MYHLTITHATAFERQAGYAYRVTLDSTHFYSLAPTLESALIVAKDMSTVVNDEACIVFAANLVNPDSE